MTEIEYIRDLYENEGLSLREIARRTHKDFRTVQKYAYRENWNPQVEPHMLPEEYPVLGNLWPGRGMGAGEHEADKDFAEPAGRMRTADDLRAQRPDF